MAENNDRMNNRNSQPTGNTQRSPQRRPTQRRNTSDTTRVSSSFDINRTAQRNPARRPARATNQSSTVPQNAVKGADTPRVKKPKQAAQPVNEKKAANSTDIPTAILSTLKRAWSSYLQLVKTSKVALVISVLVAVIVIGGLGDTLLNMGKAYGGVSVGGIDVSGLNADQMRQKLSEEFNARINHGDVLVYASQEDFKLALIEQNQKARAAEEGSDEDEDYDEDEEEHDYIVWDTTAEELGVTLPIDDAIERALAVGRSDGGILQRFGLFVSPVDLPFELKFDEDELEELAEEIDDAVGDLREDSYIEFEYGYAYAYEGHDGVMVIREHLAQALSDAYLSKNAQSYIVAQVEPAPSRISYEQAERIADAINREIGKGALFHYNGKTFHTYAYDIGLWTEARTYQLEDGSYTIKLTLDGDIAVPRLVDELDAHVKAEHTQIQMEYVDGEVIVHTSGEGKIPEVALAVQSLEEQLYGENGRIWQDDESSDIIDITIEESNTPETLTLSQARDLGVVDVLGEFTTYYYMSDESASRIHNIQLAADILNGKIVDSEGGLWRFNHETGPTDDPERGFEAANIIGEGDEYIEDYGGGICQVATTIFNAVYESGLTITLRANHTLYQPAYPDGLDAAVSYPDLDFEWRNDFKSDVLLHMSYDDESITAQILSVPTGYTIKTEKSEWHKGAKYTTEFEEDDELAEGQWYIKTNGRDGSSIEVTRTIYDADGNFISSEVFSSTYQPRIEEVVVGPGTDTSTIKTRADEDD